MVQALARSESKPPVSIRVDGPAEVARAGILAKAFAGAIGFTSEPCEEIELVARELASNLIRHAYGGTLRLSEIRGEVLPGIQIESEDAGPGISDIGRALTDGYSTGGGLGHGLGTVNRLMDELHISPGPGRGLRIISQRWPRPGPFRRLNPELVFGAATRARQCFEENGDAFIIKQWEGFALAGVIDGVGHGRFAGRASRAARQYIDQHFDQPLDRLFRGVGRACQGTRGVVMALAKFDFIRQKLTIGNIGNIEVKLVGDGARIHPVVRRGIVGFNAPELVCSECNWDGTRVLIMHSDGLDSRWEWKNFPSLAGKAPSEIAPELLHLLGRADDDATVLVARSARV